LAPHRRLILFAAAVAALGASAARADAPNDHVVLQLKWSHQFQFAGYYAAAAQGYYRDAGLTVEIRPASPTTDPVAEVLEGRADFGVGTSELVLRRSQGQPVVVLAAIYQHSPLVMLARRQPGVEDLQSLRNHPIMIEPLSAELYAYFRDEGVDPKTLHLVPHSFDVNDLLTGKVDAMSGYITDEPFILRQAKFDYLTFTPRAGGIDFYGDNLFTDESELREHPARVEAFRQASLKGWEYAMAHQDELVKLIVGTYHSSKTPEHLLYEAGHTERLIHPELIEIGHMNPGRWRRIAETYAEFGMLPKAIDWGRFLYDPFPRPNYRPFYWALAIISVVAAAALGWAVPLVRLNRRLQYEVEERRKAEVVADAANQAKGRYLAMMTHEVRTPINGIMGFAQLLGDSGLSVDQKEQLGMIEHSAQQLLRLSNDVLDYEKIEAGSVELEMLPVQTRDFLAEVCAQFSPAAVGGAVALSCTVAANVPATVITDPTRLRQILSNLLSNAIKFTPAGGRVDLTAEAAQVGGGAGLSFVVVDTGAGIDPEQLQRLFRPFAQADASVTRCHGGSGLGLFIAKRLTQLLGGGLEAESTVGAGSRFTALIKTSAEPSALGLPAVASAKAGTTRSTL